MVLPGSPQLVVGLTVSPAGTLYSTVQHSKVRLCVLLQSFVVHVLTLRIVLISRICVVEEFPGLGFDLISLRAWAVVPAQNQSFRRVRQRNLHPMNAFCLSLNMM